MKKKEINRKFDNQNYEIKSRMMFINDDERIIFHSKWPEEALWTGVERLFLFNFMLQCWCGRSDCRPDDTEN